MSAESYLNDIMEVHEEAESYSKDDILNIMYEMADEIHKVGKRFGLELKEAIAELRDEGKCPCCGEETTTKYYTANFHEEGTIHDIREVHHYSACECCGWENKEE